MEISDISSNWHSCRKLVAKWLYWPGRMFESLGWAIMALLRMHNEEDRLSLQLSRGLIDFGSALSALWLKKDPYCSYGIVVQFDESGTILRSLHAPNSSSYFKILSEAHQIADKADSGSNHDRYTVPSSGKSDLYLGSVYYSYLGHVKLTDGV